MPISSINRVKTITQKLNPSNQSSIVPVYQNTGIKIGDELIPNHKIISINTFIKNLKIFAQIASVEEAALPNFQLEDSATDKLYKTLDIEWKSPRKQISLYIASGTSDWAKVGSVSLLNPAGYPFRIYNLMDLFTDNLALELGENSKIGISIDEIGYGLLLQNDTVTIHGSYVEEIFVSYADVQPLIQVTAQVPIQLDAPITIPLTIVGGTSFGSENTTPNLLMGNDNLINNDSLIKN